MSLKFVEEMHKIAIDCMEGNELYAIKLTRTVKEILNKIDFDTYENDENIALYIFPDDRVIEVFIKPKIIAQELGNGGTDETSVPVDTVTITNAIGLKSICNIIEKQLEIDDSTRRFHVEAYSYKKREYTKDTYPELSKVTKRYLKIWFTF